VVSQVELRNPHVIASRVFCGVAIQKLDFQAITGLLRPVKRPHNDVFCVFSSIFHRIFIFF